MTKKKSPVSKGSEEKTGQSSDGIRFDGVRSIAEMLNVMDRASREKLLANLEKKDPAIVEAIKSKMFTFEDLAKIPSAGLQSLLREVPGTRLVLALRNASEDLKNTIFHNLSTRAAEVLKEELDTQGPQRLSDVTAAQQDILRIARKLVMMGKILLKEE